MTAKVSDYKNINEYSRVYANDTSHKVLLLAAPLLSFYRPLYRPIFLGMGGLRAWQLSSQLYNCEKQPGLVAHYLFHTALAVASLVGTIYRPSLGMILTTSQDLIFEVQHFSAQKGTKSATTIASHALYLALLARGGLKLSICFLTFQAAVLLMNAKEKFQEGQYLEGCGSLLMAALRVQQTYTQSAQLKRNWEIDALIKKHYVGELHEKWQFPSDHLPVGVEVNGVRILSWNVLNNAYIEWVTLKDSQGLNGSMISDLDRQVHENGLTMRDVLIADQVQSMVSSGQIIALQECSAPFVELVEQRLPSHWQMVKSFDLPRKDQEVILYDRTHFTYCKDLSGTPQTAYPSAPGRSLQNAYFIDAKGTPLRVINAHIPGDPMLPAKEEFAQYVHNSHQEGEITVALGDYNFERSEMLEAYKKAGFSEFSLHSPWQTNIDPYTKESKGIDHLFVAGREALSRDLSPDEVLQQGNLQETIDLLRATPN
ncbi:MAG: hypothetical protein JSR80_01220 [Verrucomicrobia bacterium]|nr:hypothetical protein [Verrucomicrobiota bacterium]